MILYQVRNNISQLITNQWTSDMAGENYYEECFGKQDRWIKLDEGDPLIASAIETRTITDVEATETDPAITHTEYRMSAEYTILQTDLGQSLEMNKIRSKRNYLLFICDWTQLIDSPLTQQQKNDWATYRQALRDLPQQENLDPNNPIWPLQP